MNDRLEKLIKAKHPTGSRYICHPPVMDTDEDWVVLCEDLLVFTAAAQRLGWYDQSREYWRYPEDRDNFDAPQFASLRHGTINYIATDDPAYYDKYVGATELAKKYNLLSKVDRIQLFRLVLDGELLNEEYIEEQQAARASRYTPSIAPAMEPPTDPMPYEVASSNRGAWRVVQLHSSAGDNNGSTSTDAAYFPDAVDSRGTLSEPDF